MKIVVTIDLDDPASAKAHVSALPAKRHSKPRAQLLARDTVRAIYLENIQDRRTLAEIAATYGTNITTVHRIGTRRIYPQYTWDLAE